MQPTCLAEIFSRSFEPSGTMLHHRCGLLNKHGHRLFQALGYPFNASGVGGFHVELADLPHLQRVET